jgi:hypothetical protein
MSQALELSWNSFDNNSGRSDKSVVGQGMRLTTSPMCMIVALHAVNSFKQGPLPGFHKLTTEFYSRRSQSTIIAIALDLSSRVKSKDMSKIDCFVI